MSEHLAAILDCNFCATGYRLRRKGRSKCSKFYKFESLVKKLTGLKTVRINTGKQPKYRKAHGNTKKHLYTVEKMYYLSKSNILHE